MPVIEQRYGRWYIRAVQSIYTGDWTAWASLERLYSTSPLLEKAQDIWFEFGQTASEAINKLKEELDSL